jgi:hypothetical protein
MQKDFYFLCSLPRSGNTLLGSILNQNSKISVTSMSIVPEILKRIYLVMETEHYKNFPDFNSFKNVFNNIHKLYYENWKSDVIIERGPWGTPDYMYLLDFFMKESKYIILYRPVLQCLASFFKIKNVVDKETLADRLMSHTQFFGENLWSIRNIINSNKKYIVVHYDDLIKNPKEEIKKIYKFINLPFQEHKFENIEQFKANNISYDDYFLDGFYHTIKTDKIEKNNYKIEDILPASVIKKYSNMDVL